jgi:exodeoxyribonuclease VII large subunit
MLNPQRTLERGYAVILCKGKDRLHAVRNQDELKTKQNYQIRLTEGQAEVLFEEILGKES